MKIALCSPNKNVYSETFIQAHKKFLKGDIFYYYDEELPKKLESGLIINSRKKRLLDLVKGHLNLNRFSLAEQAVMTSFRNNNIQLVFAEYGGTGERLVPICKELEIPLITHFHGFDASRKSVLKKYANYTELFKYASFIIVVSEEMKNDLLAMGCPEEKLILNTYGPSEDYFEVEPEFKSKNFVSVGRFTDKKAPYYLIYSFLEVIKEYPEASLTIIGEGELYNTCKNLVKFHKLENTVNLPGIKTKDEIKQEFAGALAYVQHSIEALDGDKEGTPVSILEASASGLPVIATSHAGIRDVIKDDYNGYLIKEHEVEKMASYMIQLIEDPKKAREFGANGRANIKNNFLLEEHIDKLNELIEQATKK